jgi:hypothetical protein
MVVFMYRPSPQVPRPSLDAAIRCYDACQYNIYMTMKQIETKSVDVYLHVHQHHALDTVIL